MKKLGLIIILFISIGGVKAQKNQEAQLRSLEVLENNGVVQGYYSLLKVGKEDRKNEEFQLSIYDLNLKITHQKGMVKPRMTNVSGALFNGENFFFFFKIPTMKNGMQVKFVFEIDVFTKTAELVETIKPDPKDVKFHSSIFLLERYNKNIVHEMFLGVKNVGMVSYYSKKVKGFKGQRANLSFYNNKGTKVWDKNIGSISKDKVNESVIVYYADSDKMIAKFSSYKSIWSYRDKLEYLLIVDTKTGNIRSKTLIDVKNGFIPGIKVNYHTNVDEVSIIGKVYPLNEKGAPQYKNEDGLIIITYNKDGEIKNENFIKWGDNPVANKAGLGSEGKINENTLIHHELRVLDNGEKYLITEQVGKGGKSFKTGSFMIFKFDNSNVLENISSFSKSVESKKMEVVGVGYTGGDAATEALALLYGAYAFEFVTMSKDFSKFNIVYTSYNKGKENKESRNTIGVISLSKEGEFVQSEFTLNSNADRFNVYPARNGYVAVYEYFEKEKKIDFRLEKLDL